LEKPRITRKKKNCGQITPTRRNRRKGQPRGWIKNGNSLLRREQKQNTQDGEVSQGSVQVGHSRETNKPARVRSWVGEGEKKAWGCCLRGG